MKINKVINKVERWCIWEIELHGTDKGNPFIDVKIEAEFSYKNRVQYVNGFYDGDGVYKVRFMPDTVGEWKYNIATDGDVFEGSFECTKAKEVNHGPVRVKEVFHFEYEDGAPYLPVGTTCYVWTHQGDELEERTLKTLSISPFNKIRMCVFPKSYDYNSNEPEFYPLEGSLEQGWDFTRFDTNYFSHLEKRIKDLMDLGIQADIILFHPYDKWGFSSMSKQTDDLYLSYIVSRLSAYRNVWWSLANEFDLIEAKATSDWERFAKIIMENDPHNHLRSIHNCIRFYDHTKPWITHCSLQRQDVFKTSENTDEWRERFGKPVVIDECGYEGNIQNGWGNITGQEMTRRFWEGAIRGGYVGHGETYLNDDEILWWSKGGELVGSSVERIAFLRKIMEQGPLINPIKFDHIFVNWDVTCGGHTTDYYIYYFGFSQPSFRTFNLPQGKEYFVDVIDTWNMTITTLEGKYEGKFTIDLPAKQYMAVRMRVG